MVWRRPILLFAFMQTAYRHPTEGGAWPLSGGFFATLPALHVGDHGPRLPLFVLGEEDEENSRWRNHS